MKINGLDFENTCTACPEQYDVYLGDRKVGYVRLRWGGLTAYYPDIFEEIIFEDSVGNGYTGEFESDEQRIHYLKLIAKKLIERTRDEK